MITGVAAFQCPADDNAPPAAVQYVLNTKPI
jgi:hypothetical protein